VVDGVWLELVDIFVKVANEGAVLDEVTIVNPTVTLGLDELIYPSELIPRGCPRMDPVARSDAVTTLVELLPD
jgi:hypothetical protein